MERYKILGWVLIAMFLTLTGCSMKGQSVSKESVNRISVAKLRETMPSHVSDETETDGKILTIEADISASGLENIKEVSLAFDENLFNTFVNKLIDAEDCSAEEKNGEDGERIWEDVRNGVTYASVSLTNTGFVSYLNVEEDRNLPFLDKDGEHIFEYGYISEQIPPTMELSALEASEKSRDFLKEYSCMTFQPWNILAQGDIEMADGCYVIELQGVYGGIPVSVKSDSNMQPLSAAIYYSNEGIFSIQGNFLLSEKENHTLTGVVSFDDILENYRFGFADLCVGDRVIVDEIRLEYFPQLAADNSFLLKAVWCLACEDIREENIDGTSQEIRIKYNVLYFAEDGKLCGLYY